MTMFKRLPYAVMLATLVLWAGAASPEVIDKIVVVVNNEIITQREIDRNLMPVYEQYKTAYSGEELVTKLEEARQAIIERMIEDRLVVSEAKKLNIEIPEADVEARIDDLKKRVGSAAAFERLLREQDMMLKDLRQRYKEQLMARRLIDIKVNATITFTPLEVSEYYKAHMAEFTQPEELKISNILIRPKEGESPQAAANFTKELLVKIREGGDFAGLARKYSVGPNADGGGLMEGVKKGELMPEIEKVIFAMKPGEVSDVVQTAAGYHIFKLEERSEAKTLGFMEIRRQVEEVLYREKAQVKIKELMDGLKKNAYIAFK